MGDPLEDAKKGVEIIGELIKAAGDNPDVKEAGKNIGQAALTISKTINNALLPLAAVNFAFDKARIYFAEKFQEDLSKKASSIPLEKIVEPKASIAGPALQGLAFAHEEPDLKNMYLSLLANAMDGRVSGEVHPAFVEILKQLNSEEASLLKVLLPFAAGLPIVEIRKQINSKQGWNCLGKHVMDFKNSTTNQPIENKNLPAMIDNWVRLGLVEVDYGTFFVNENSYKWVEQRPEFKKLCEQFKNDEDVKVVFQRGMIVRSALGFQFAQAVGIIKEQKLEEKREV